MTVSAQAVYENGVPYSSENSKDLKNANDIAVMVMPELNYEKLLDEDEKDNDAGMAPRFGFLHEVTFSLKNAGNWELLPNGDRIWRLTIFAPRARTININYSKYNIPLGGKLFIYNKDKTDVIGPFTRKNEKVNGEFATGFTKGEECTIEYYEPRKAIGKSDIEISGIVHGYKSIRNFVDDFLKAFGTSGSCNNDVNCAISSGWEDQIKSVALHILADGTRWCSGALINNTANDCTPYFLTADHCFENVNVGTVLNDLFVFNYHSPTPACPGTPSTDGSTSESITGGTIISKAVDSDFCLIELSANPKDLYDVYYSGWDRSNTAANSAVGIHHPDGDVKKISFENDPLQSSTYGNVAGTHWEVPNWDAGTTEPGSSGSPLFDQTTKRIVGQLHGGDASCSGNSNNGSSDWYGKIWYSWDQNGPANTKGLATWLDPTNSGVMFIDNTNCSTPLAPIAAFSPANMSSFTFCTTGDIQLTDASLGIPTSWSWTLSGAGVSPTTSSAQSPFITVTNSGTLTATLVATNAQGSDTKAQTYAVTVNPCSPCETHTLTILTDDYPDETSWDVKDANGIVVASDGSYTTANTTETETFCLDVGVCYDFTIYDSEGDGICCGFGNGSYMVTNASNTVLVTGGSFGSSQTTNICPSNSTLNCFMDLTNNNGLGTNETGGADYESSTYIRTNATTVIQSGAKVDYDATKYIELNPNFEVKLGALFEAFIDGCNNGAGGVNVTEEAGKTKEK